jgi:hypothetical protein
MLSKFDTECSRYFQKELGSHKAIIRTFCVAHDPSTYFVKIPHWRITYLLFSISHFKISLMNCKQHPFQLSLLNYGIRNF